MKIIKKAKKDESKIVNKKNIKDFFKRVRSHKNIKVISCSKNVEDGGKDRIFSLFEINKRYKSLTQSMSQDLSSCCDFKEGACVLNRKIKNKPKDISKDVLKLVGTKNGCCSNCSKEVGYLRTISSEDIGFFSKVWDSEKGFLGSDGCRLPLSYRSSTCISFLCPEARQNTKLTDFELSFLRNMYAISI